eukprot:4571395-Heterocapsa_arctica.AAC.1
MKGESLDEQWKYWNAASEQYLGQVGKEPSQYYKGRGKPISLVQNTASAPQDNSGGFATTSDVRQRQQQLNILKKHSILVNKGKGHTHLKPLFYRLSWEILVLRPSGKKKTWWLK